MERFSSLHQVVILLAFFHLIISSTAIPSSRDQRMLQDSLDLQDLNDTPQRAFEELDLMAEEVLRGRMNLQNNDYPGSGANNRHTPKQQGRKLK